MKLVTAMIRPFKLEDVRRALLGLGHVASISKVEAMAPRREFERGTPHAIEATRFYAKIKVEVLVPAAEAEKAITLLRNAALTGRLGEGDGIVFVSDVEHAVRIRTGAKDDEAV